MSCEHGVPSGKCVAQSAAPSPLDVFTLFNKLNNFISHPEDTVLELCGFELEGRKKIYEVLKVSLTLRRALFRMKVFIFGAREGEVRGGPSQVQKAGS
jgi:hypothetical protein